MKKSLIVIAAIIAILCLNKQEEIIIPNESIRFRVVANSNTSSDQNLKKSIVSSLKEKILEIENSSSSIEEARTNIQKEIPQITEQVNNELKKANYTKDVKVNYGQNYFPKKVYKGITYQDGNYESLVITIGEGNGNNFWCVLFPPLCNIDTKTEDIEYTSLVKEIINKYSKKA